MDEAVGERRWTEEAMIRLLLVDDHEAILLGLTAALEQTEDLTVVGCARDGRTAVSMAETLRPDVIVMDLSMAGLDGVSSTRQIMASDPHARVVVLSFFGRPTVVDEALFFPHLSLVYGELDSAAKEELAGPLAPRRGERWRVDELQVVRTDGEPGEWRLLAGFPLSRRD